MFKSWEPSYRQKVFLTKARKKDLASRTARYPSLKNPFLAKIAQPGYELSDFDKKVVEKIRWIEERKKTLKKTTQE